MVSATLPALSVASASNGCTPSVAVSIASCGQLATPDAPGGDPASGSVQTTSGATFDSYR
jgi:hypothetical protein